MASVHARHGGGHRRNRVCVFASVHDAARTCGHHHDGRRRNAWRRRRFILRRRPYVRTRVRVGERARRRAKAACVPVCLDVTMNIDAQQGVEPTPSTALRRCARVGERARPRSCVDVMDSMVAADRFRRRQWYVACACWRALDIACVGIDANACASVHARARTAWTSWTPSTQRLGADSDSVDVRQTDSAYACT